jgi:uncharacterized cupin superfamily protein
MQQRRPAFIRHWQELEGQDNEHYPGSEERLGIGAPLGRALGLTRLGIHHERLLPGRRTSYPHAERHEEEFAYVLEGEPDVWINGALYPLKPGDAVAFPAGTGICHTFINNSDREVRLMIVGEANKAENEIYYPMDPDYAATRTDRWESPPPQDFGPHPGKPDKR